MRKSTIRRRFTRIISGNDLYGYSWYSGKTIDKTPRVVQRTKVASREEAIASTRQFFAIVDRRNMNTIEADTHEREAIEVPNVSTTTQLSLM